MKTDFRRLVLIGLLLGSLDQAQAEDAAGPHVQNSGRAALHQDQTKMNFDGSHLDGIRQLPGGVFLRARAKSGNQSMIRLRSDFRDKLLSPSAKGELGD
jgi:hypothetical protein